MYREQDGAGVAEGRGQEGGARDECRESRGLSGHRRTWAFTAMRRGPLEEAERKRDPAFRFESLPLTA